MLDDDRGGGPEEPSEARGAVEIEEVVVGELLPAELLETGEADARAGRGVERRRLVRILAVAKREALLELEGETGGERSGIGGAGRGGQGPGRGLGDEPGMPGHPGGDRRVIGGGPLEGPGREQAPFGDRRAAPGDHRGELGILIGPGDHRREGMVLGCRPNEARAADVDQLDGIGRPAVGLRDDRLEGIEIDDHRIDRPDAVAGHDVDVIGTVAAIEEPGEDVGMERLHPAVEDLGETGDCRDVGNLHAMCLKGPSRAAGADDLDPSRFQRGGELIEARLVVDAHEHPPQRDRIGNGNWRGQSVVECAHAGIRPARGGSEKGRVSPPRGSLGGREPHLHDSPSPAGAAADADPAAQLGDDRLHEVQPQARSRRRSFQFVP